MDYLVINQNKKIPTKIAISVEEQERGLMERSVPYVLAFPSNTAKVRKFWMKNTPAPLDVIFCRAGKIIDICAGVPFSEELFGPNEPTDLVVEFPFGMAKKMNLCPGQTIKLAWSMMSLAKKFANQLKSPFIKQAGRIDLSKYSAQIFEIQRLIESFLGNDFLVNPRRAIWKVEEKLKKPHSLGIVEFSFEGEIVFLEVFLNFGSENNPKGAFKKALSESESENDSILINLSPFLEEKDIKLQLQSYIAHEVTHFIDSFYTPEQNLNFSESDFDSDGGFVGFFDRFEELYLEFFKNDSRNFSHFEDYTKNNVLKLIKTKKFKILLSEYGLKLNQQLLGKLFRVVENLYLRQISFHQMGGYGGLFGELSQKDLDNQSRANQDYYNSKGELKAYLNHIIQEIEENFYQSSMSVFDLFRKFDLSILLKLSPTYLKIKDYLNADNLLRMEAEIAKYFQKKFSRSSLQEKAQKFGIELSEQDELKIRYLRFLEKNHPEKLREKLQDKNFLTENKTALRFLAAENKLWKDLDSLQKSFLAA